MLQKFTICQTEDRRLNKPPKPHKQTNLSKLIEFKLINGMATGQFVMINNF